MTLNAYMGFDSAAGSHEGAILIFAKTAKEARKIGWHEMKMLHDTSWVDMAVRRQRKNLTYLYGDGDFIKLKDDVPHVVVDMRVCPSCELWGEDGGEPDENGQCGYCRDE